jgi:hypothetical protein
VKTLVKKLVSGKVQMPVDRCLPIDLNLVDGQSGMGPLTASALATSMPDGLRSSVQTNTYRQGIDATK